MNLDTAFMLELLLVVILIAVFLGAFLYLTVLNRRTRRETGRRVGTAGIPVGPEPGEPEGAPGTAPRQPPQREFYKRMGLETAEEMKIRIYSIAEYRDEFGGTTRDNGFKAALKAYRQLDDEWYDYSPRRAADVLGLAPEDYEVDEEGSALLLRRLPSGLPESARDIL